MRLLVATLAAFALCGAIHAQDAGFRFETTPGRLPKTIRPVQIDVSIAPNARLDAFDGRVAIDADVTAPAPQIVLDALGLRVLRATVDGTAVRAQVDDAAQQMTLTPARPLSPGKHRIVIVYRGKIEEGGEGFYRVRYHTPQGERTMLATQFEPLAARRMLPCFDEPSFRTRYIVHATMPAGWTAISNGEVAAVKPAAGGRRETTFAPSPSMASYLLALFAGDFDKIETREGDTTLRIFAVRGRVEQGRVALDATQKLLRFYNDYFGVAYPLPKLDQIAVPGGFSGAMENWGAIAYHEPALLIDPKRTSVAREISVVSVIAHEFAHQWFGDLVTMAWWDDLWLNEGFATWMERKAMNAVRPDLHADDREGLWKHRAMEDDALGPAGPIRRRIDDERAASASFDSITYAKGAAFIGMLEAYVGETTFRDGIRAHMRAHAYSNATTADLWDALSAAAHQPVAPIARAWVEQPGLPELAVARICDAQGARLSITQSPFIALPVAGDDVRTKRRWPVPTTIGLGPDFGKRVTVLVEDAPAVVPLSRCDEPAKLNLADRGYYRVRYDAASLAALQGAYGALSTADRINVLDDTWAALNIGHATLDDLIGLIASTPSNERSAYWNAVTRYVATLDAAAHESGRDGVWASQRDRLRAALAPRLQTLGYVPQAGEDRDREAARIELYGLLSTLGDPHVIADARARFARDEPLSSMTGVVLATVGRTATPDEWSRLRTKLATATSEREHDYALDALGEVRDPALIDRTLALTLDPSMSPESASQLLRAIATHGDAAHTWGFVVAHWDALSARMSPWISEALPARVAAFATDVRIGTAAVAFTREHIGQHGLEPAQRAEAAVRVRSAWVDRALKAS